MIKFKVDNQEFTMRSAGIIVHNGKVLVQKRKKDTYWALPGGKVELMEKSENAVIREIEEELNIKSAKIKRLVYLNELFFTFENVNVHQVAFYYLVDLPTDAYILNKEGVWNGVEKDADLVYTWLCIDDIENQPIQPLFLKEELKNISSGFKHVVQDEIHN